MSDSEKENKALDALIVAAVRGRRIDQRLFCATCGKEIEGSSTRFEGHWYHPRCTPGYAERHPEHYRSELEAWLARVADGPELLEQIAASARERLAELRAEEEHEA